jgi:dihydrofolate reductase
VKEKQMGKIALSQNTALDGVMQSPGPADVPFKYRGWAVDFADGPEGARFNYEEEVGLEQAQNSEALLLGRVTYEAMHAFWPTAEGELADRLNELPKYVVSSTLRDPPWNATVLGDDWPEEVARLRTELDGEIIVYGSRRLSQALIGMGLVDELRLLVYPGGARCRRSPVRGDAGQDRAAPGRIASARGRRGEHDLCTRHGGRVMQTLRINSRERLRPILRQN